MNLFVLDLVTQSLANEFLFSVYIIQNKNYRTFFAIKFVYAEFD